MISTQVPRLPQKKLKLFQDHNDTAFLEARRRDLDGYVAKLVHVPHVWATPPAAPFVGVANNVREYSVVFPERTLGFTLGKSSGAESRENDFPAFVASCRPPDCPVDVRIGDLLSKISGRSVATMTFAERATVPNSNLQTDFNVSVRDGFDEISSAVLRELDESNRFVQKSAESTSM